MTIVTTLSKNQNIALYVLIIGLFFIQPFVAITLLVLICYASAGQGTSIWHRNLFILISLSILLLAIINSSKVNDNDLYYYIRWFKQSGNVDLVNHISNQQKKSEVAYAIYVWFVNHLISDNEAVFKFLTTVIQYIFLNLATLKFCNKITVNKTLVMITVMLTCFNPYVFSLSIQLLRQSLAVSIFLYVMVEHCLCNKNHWVLIALCPLIHTMTLLLVVLLFLPTLKKPIQKNIPAYSIIILVLASISFISNYLLSLSLFNDTASYALQRASMKKVFDLGEATPITILLDIIILSTSFYCGQIQTRRTNNPMNNGVRQFFNIPTLLSIFVLLNVNLSEIFGRFLMLLYPFIPFIFISLLKNSKISRQVFLWGSIMLLIIFTYLIQHSVWSYKYLDNILYSGLLYLI